MKRFFAIHLLSGIFFAFSSCKTTPTPPTESSVVLNSKQVTSRSPGHSRDDFLLKEIHSSAFINNASTTLKIQMTFKNQSLTHSDFDQVIRVFDEPGHGYFAFQKSLASKKYPFNLGRYKLHKEFDSQHPQSFKLIMNAWMDGYRLFTKRTMVFDCSQQRSQQDTQASWTQSCVAKPHQKDNSEFYESYQQNYHCKQTGPKDLISCSIELTAVTKKVSVPGIVEFLFGVKSYSGFKAALLLTESMLRGYYYLAQLTHSSLKPEELYDTSYQLFVQKGWERSFMKIFDDFLIDEKQYKEKVVNYQF
jgi:hypothetical protein